MTQISVILPVYNDEKYVAKAIESILSSTYTNFELIIINDGSSDSTLEIINKFKDERIKLFSKMNSGLIDTLNFGLKKCNSKIFMRADGDDIIHNCKIQKQLNYYKYSKSILVGTEAFIIDNDENIINSISLPNDHNTIIKRLLNLKSGIIHGTIMGSVEAIRNIGFYSEKIKHAEDYDLFFRLSKIGRFSNLNEKLYYIRKNNENVSFLNSSEQLLNTLITRKHYLTSNDSELISNKKYEDVKKSINKNFFVSIYFKIHNNIVQLEFNSKKKYLLFILKIIRVCLKKLI